MYAHILKSERKSVILLNTKLLLLSISNICLTQINYDPTFYILPTHLQLCIYHQIKIHVNIQRETWKDFTNKKQTNSCLISVYNFCYCYISLQLCNRTSKFHITIMHTKVFHILFFWYLYDLFMCQVSNAYLHGFIVYCYHTEMLKYILWNLLL